MSTWEVRTGDALEQLRGLPERSVQCVVTSPPYFGLRDYGTGQWDGGDAACTHRVGGQVADSKAPASITAGIRPGVDATRCRDCGARRVDLQIGLEPTPEQYTATLVDVFREVRRVLRDDGTVWLNLGDSYASAPPGNKRPGAGERSTLHTVMSERYRETLDSGKGTKRDTRVAGVKAKDLIGIPWLVAFALRADGWYLRSEIVWAKPNPMPESVGDRPTCAHEKLFLLAKRDRYHYDAEAIKEPDSGRPSGNSFITTSTGQPRLGHRLSGGLATGGSAEKWEPGAGRNKRNVWTITTQPYGEAHFATFPPKLVEPCILAGCPPAGVVLDPFAGAGTTGMVALRLDRSFIGIELNPEFAELARWRIRDDAPLINTLSEVA